MLRNIYKRPENYTQACRRATLELQREHHKFLGIMDVVKAMLMWIETTDERARKNLSPRVDSNCSAPARVGVPAEASPIRRG